MRSPDAIDLDTGGDGVFRVAPRAISSRLVSNGILDRRKRIMIRDRASARIALAFLILALLPGTAFGTGPVT
jgi:hypothetical protein